MIRALIVDDERHARQKIRTLLASQPDIEIVRECANGDDAVKAIVEAHPDLVFLDVQMPGRSGFDVLRDAGGAVRHVVFVTAFDKYAVQAFEVQALDYLLKPFDRARFDIALQRVRERLRDGIDLQEKLREIVEQMAPKATPLDRIMIKSAGRITFLRVGEIDWIEAADNYVRLHAGRDAHLIRETMTNLETQLDRRKFVRIHRSAIVNIDAIVEIRSLFHGDHSVLLRSGAEIPLGRAYRERLEAAFGKPL
ncbi:MAG TPA: LytTR family transcriptional regulator DNA-binding domain-containing protein [Thermoanaerobaculia bacterium]|nr:LytTR family transcriptional regulator DNA-binding domain-containing protein [Thermoanaerobaculia bacterium]